MAKEDVPLRPSEYRTEARNTEIVYHTKLNRWIAIFCTPLFIFFAIFHYGLGSSLQTFLFTLLAVNAILAVVIGSRIEDMKNRILHKHITSAIAFGILGISLLTGVFSDSMYIFLPWIFVHPIGGMLFFGPRVGFISALVFCSAMTGAIVMAEPPPMDDFNKTVLKLNAVFALLVIFCIAWMSERIRVRVQRYLVEAQNEAKVAEKRQRYANLELQGEIELRIRSEKNLTQSEVRYRALFEESAVSLLEEDWSQVKVFLDELPQEAADNLSGYFKADPKALQNCLSLIKVTAVNRATLKLYEAEDVSGLLDNLSKILPPGANDYFAERVITLYEKGRYSAETTARTLNGRTLHLLISSTIPAGFEESWQRIFTSVYDVTERMILEEEKKRLDQQMQYGRQIQAVATLAGGIAHQFNNALAIITGNLDLIRFNPKSETRNDHYIQSLQKAVDRMSRLTDQLLAYAQGGKYRPQLFSANDLVRDTLNSEKIAFPTSIQVALDLDPNVSMSSGDVTQIKMVIEAILSNAVESMNGNGKVFISTGNIFIDEENPAGSDNLRRGKYAFIRVDDMGMGMDEQTCQRIFEPFFTTKYFGRGLGMAAAFGIVKNHDGLITVQSEPGKGTRISIYLPVLDHHDIAKTTMNAA
jgi:signal transduction histidine kinase